MTNPFPGYLGHHRILDVLGESLLVPRPSLVDTLGRDSARYVKSSDTLHGEYLLRFDNGRMLVLLIDGPHENYKYVAVEVYGELPWVAEYRLVKRDVTASIVETFVYQGNDVVELRTRIDGVRGKNPHLLDGPGMYTDTTGERTLMSSIKYETTFVRMSYAVSHGLSFSSTKLERWVF